ncbi:hypothetical protein ABW19_dt0208986 [Dactylella cylindrospora]|nr:hypothetical protein ABW19_dt0208986 [Dactylella cylindrospora]
MLEDESGRIRLVGSAIMQETLVTGCVIAVMGTETASGEFEVIDMVYSELPPQTERPVPESSDGGKKYIGLISGLNITGNMHESMETHLLVEYLLGENPKPVKKDRPKRQYVNSLLSVRLGHIAYQMQQSKKYGYDAAAYNSKPTTTLDGIISDLCTSISVTLMPGDLDPANASLPQQKMHPTMFPSSKYYTGSTFIPATNPCACEIDGVRFLGTSGQTIDDIFKYVEGDDRLEMMERTLRWRHVAPTAPDTLCTFTRGQFPCLISC